MILRLVSWNVNCSVTATNAALNFLTDGIQDLRQNQHKPPGATSPAYVDLAIILEPPERDGDLNAAAVDSRCFDLVNGMEPDGPGPVAGRANLGGMGQEKENAYLVYCPKPGLVVEWAESFAEAQANNRKLTGIGCRLPFTVYVETVDFKIALSGVHAPVPEKGGDAGRLTRFLDTWGPMVGNDLEENIQGHIAMGDFNTLRKAGQWGGLIRLTPDVITALNEHGTPTNPYDAAWAIRLDHGWSVGTFSGRAVATSQMSDQETDMSRYIRSDFKTTYSDHVPIYLELQCPQANATSDAETYAGTVQETPFVPATPNL